MNRNDFDKACRVVEQVTQQTKLIESKYLSDRTGNRVFLKPENMQVTGSFKIRGAYYKISTLTEEERKRGLITASAGNHAQGVAYAAKEFGVRAIIVMPKTTPLIKVNRTKSYGAEVVLYGDDYSEALECAKRLCQEHDYTFVDVTAQRSLHAFELYQHTAERQLFELVGTLLLAR